MAFYPVFLDLRGRLAVVAGGGPVAVRKMRGLLEAGAHVRVISPELSEELPVEWKRRRYRRGDLAGAALAFAATNDRAANRRIAEHAAELGIPVNVADRAAECSFLVPARIRRGRLQIAISTSGDSPRVAKSLRKQLEKLLDQCDPET
jgi:siroheme synthase-like protein